MKIATACKNAIDNCDLPDLPQEVPTELVQSGAETWGVLIVVIVVSVIFGYLIAERR